MHRFLHRLFLLAALLCLPSFAQVGFQLAPVAHQQFTDKNGAPLAGGFVFTYSAGSTTPLATYKDNASTANTNPIVLDAGGFATIYLSQNSYKFVVQNSSSVQQWTQDNIQNFAQIIFTSANTWTLAQTFSTWINFVGGTSDTTANIGNLFYRTDLDRLRWYGGAWHSIVGADTSDTLTNKTLTAPNISAPAVTGNMTYANTTPVANLTTSPTAYSINGTQIMNAHIVRVDSTALVAGTVTITFSGSAVFTGANTYQCGFNDLTAAAAVKYVETNGTTVVITGTGTDNIAGICIGN